jgi:hypothetical protein
MVALNSWVGRAVFHLACSPATGDLPSPASSCLALKTKPELVTSPKPSICIGSTTSWWDITITGRLNGKSIRRSFSTCWTTQMETLDRLGLTWDSLRKHLVPRRHEDVFPGTSRVFPPGVLRATDLVTCVILGHRLELGVPIQTDGPASTGYGGVNVTSVTLQVAHNSNGTVSASCHRANA